MSENKTCEERIDDQLAFFETQAEYVVRRYEGDSFDLDDDNDKGLVSEFGDGYDPDDWAEPLYNVAIGISTKLVIRIELSAGGPSSYLEVYCDEKTGEVDNVYYHFLDWFDGARRKVPKNSYTYRYAEHIASVIAETR